MPEAGKPSPPSHGSIRIAHEAGKATLLLSGEIDLDVVRAFESAGEPTPSAVAAIDAGAVTHLSAAGVALMLRYRDASLRAGSVIPLRRSNAHVDRVLRILRLADAFG